MGESVIIQTKVVKTGQMNSEIDTYHLNIDGIAECSKHRVTLVELSTLNYPVRNIVNIDSRTQIAKRNAYQLSHVSSHNVPHGPSRHDNIHFHF